MFCNWRNRSIVILVVFMMVLPSVTSYIQSNIAYIRMNKSSFTTIVEVEDMFSRAAKLYANNSSSFRGIALAYLLQGKLDKSLNAWRVVQVTAKDMVIHADWANRANDLDTAIKWLLIAEQLDPNSSELWYTAGKTCRKLAYPEGLCTRFLVRNDQNWLLNSDFTFGQNNWNVRQAEGFVTDYEIVDCPGREDLCGYIGAEMAVPKHGLSWSQCLKIKPNQSYKFSAWIKIDVQPDGKWIPIYSQGILNGVIKGYWPGTQHGASDWKYWERTFTTPTFEDNQACFYPIRLLSPGRAWFYSAKLELITK